MRESSRSQGSPKPRRFLGLELAGAKNQKTALATLEYYPREKKIFLLDVYDRIAGHDEQSSDEALMETISAATEGGAQATVMAVNVPLTLPPCLTCSRRTCPAPGKCSHPASRWMREIARKHAVKGRARPFTPYTQRPVELWVRYQVFPQLPPEAQFEIDETLGGNKAPLTARMIYLKKYLNDLTLIETWPKLTIALLAAQMSLPKRVIARYRQLEEGAHARGTILDALSKEHGIFIYDRDHKKLSFGLASFDAFVCAYSALLSDTGRCAPLPRGFPKASGWIEYPALSVHNPKA